MRRLIRFSLFLALLLLGTLMLGNSAERWMIYPFTPIEVAPAEAGVPRLEEHRLSRGDETLLVWAAPPRQGQPVIFYLHGNAGNLASRAGRFNRFLDRGYGVVALAYPGSSGSTGRPSESSLTEAARFAYDRLLNDAFHTGANTPVVIYGESLGTAVATQLLVRLSKDQKPGAVVLEAPFTSLGDLATFHYGETVGILTKSLESQWDTVVAAPKALTPALLVIHGSDDALIPIAQGRSVFQAAETKYKEFMEVSGGQHSDLWRSDTLPKLWAFIAAHS